MKRIRKCRCCKKNNLFVYLNLGNQPLANGFHKGQILSKYPLKVMLCLSCFHSQLSIVVNPDDMFRNYLYVSGTTETFRKHCEDLAKDANSRFSKKLNVLDIACNDGTLLEYFKKLGCNVQGVDPAKNLRKITKEKKIPVIVDYWKKDIALSLYKKFHIITGTNVFAHVDDLDEFLEASKIALTDDGVLILEFPYGQKMIENNEFDTVYHEHLSYFLVNSFGRLAKRMHFSIIDVIQTPIHGGSIRFFLKKGIGKNTSKIEKLIKIEKKKGLLKKSIYLKLSKRVRKNKQDMKKLLNSLSNAKKKVVGYGASAKGNTMLNYFNISLEYIVDDNSLKWGYLTPGTNIPILSPKQLSREKEPFYILILSWNFYKEINAKIRSLNQSEENKSILYVPLVKINKI